MSDTDREPNPVKESAEKHQTLFDFFSQEHGLTLTVTEMHDIVRAVRAFEKENSTPPNIKDSVIKEIERIRDAILADDTPPYTSVIENLIECIEAAKPTPESDGLTELQEQVHGLTQEIEDAIESQKQKELPVPDWLKGQLHAYNTVIRKINEQQ